jgi:hypothetical protein
MDFHIPCRRPSLIALGAQLRKYAVGYCDGASVSCRPKTGNKAVMFYKDGRHFWFHMTNYEFEEVFNAT